jgi:hypothetical protein
VQELVARLYATPRPVVERVKKLLAPYLPGETLTSIPRATPSSTVAQNMGNVAVRAGGADIPLVGARLAARIGWRAAWLGGAAA